VQFVDNGITSIKKRPTQCEAVSCLQTGMPEGGNFDEKRRRMFLSGNEKCAYDPYKSHGVSDAHDQVRLLSRC
jgi:hypothetical protein